MGRMMGPSGVSGMILSYHGAGGDKWMGFIVEVEQWIVRVSGGM